MDHEKRTMNGSREDGEVDRHVGGSGVRGWGPVVTFKLGNLGTCPSGPEHISHCGLSTEEMYGGREVKVVPLLPLLPLDPPLPLVPPLSLVPPLPLLPLVPSVARPSLPYETCKMGQGSHTVHTFARQTVRLPRRRPCRRAIQWPRPSKRGSRNRGGLLKSASCTSSGLRSSLHFSFDFSRRNAVVVARLRVCLTPLVVTLMSSVMQPQMFAFLPLPCLPEVPPVPVEQVAGHTLVPYGVCDGH